MQVTATSNGAASVDSKSEPPRAERRAYDIPEFCEAYRIGRTTAYAEIAAGRLRARKVGRRRLIGVNDAEEWWGSKG
jgi:excisionase family DNA binding protein